MASKDQPTKDAVSMLMDDHKRVKGLFDEFKKFAEANEDDYVELKQELMDVACEELKVHMAIEEEIFYPAVRKALRDEDDLLNEAEVEHAGAKDLIAQIENSSAGAPMTCAKFTVLGEYIEHHVKEEETDMFPKTRKSGLDLDTLGEEMAARKQELQSGRLAFDAPTGDPKNPSFWDRLRVVSDTIAAPR
ncbi:MAG: hemerythrin domain-containing protein [Betaproteobacteria bacterium]